MTLGFERTGHLGWLVVLGSVLCALTVMPFTSRAQTLVITNFTDLPRTRGLGSKTKAALERALERKDIELIPYQRYRFQAKRYHIPRSQELSTVNLRLLARSMRFDGVLTGSAKRRKRVYIFSIRLIGSNGRLLLKKSYSLDRPRFSSKRIDKLARLIQNSLGSKADSISDTTEDIKATQPTAEKSAEKDEINPGETVTVAKVTIEADQGAVSDILISVGMSLNLREGLRPKHEMNLPVPGIRVDGRVFLGAFLDVPVVEDMGIGGMFNQGLASKYVAADQDESFDSRLAQWRGELAYRLAFNQAPLAPAFLFRLGYGSTSCTIDTDMDQLLSASYYYPYIALDIYLMLARPIVRFFISGGHMFTVSAKEDLSGRGLGFSLMTGLEFDLINAILVGVGFELVTVFIKDDNKGETSDSYKGFFVRAGWAYH